MDRSRYSCALIVFALLSIVSARAQTTPDVTGHWAGSVSAPTGDVVFEIDLVTNAKGELAGTVDLPAEGIVGLRLTKVALEGRAVVFHAREDQFFKGVIAADGKSVAGDFFVSGGSVPFTMTRLGDARTQVVAKNPPIRKELEGTWNGAVDVQGKPLRMILTMSNQTDGTSAGSLVVVDQGGLEIPAATISDAESNLRLEFKAVGGSYVGSLSTDGMELIGTYQQRGASLPLTFRRAAK